VDFDPTVSGYTSSTAVSGNDAYLVKLDAAGNFGWVRGFGSVGTDDGSAVAVDGSGNVYVGGTFWGTVDFNPSSTATHTVTAVGAYDSYISKFDAAGNFQFVKTVGSTGSDKCKDLKISPSGHIVYVGNFSGNCDFDPSSAGTYTLASGGVFDGFASVLDGSGNFVWAGVLATNGFDYFEGVAINSTNDIYLSGSYLFTNDFNMGSGTFNMTSAGNNDWFVTKLSTGFAGIKEEVSNDDMAKVYPNPSNGKSWIELKERSVSDIKLTITDISGREISSKYFQTNETKFELNIETKGLYFVILESGENKSVKKLVVQ
jgi:hypothetical protein